MFRPMRRATKEISREECIAILERERRGVLALVADGGYPYGVPMNYIYDADADKIYFHSAREGQKVEYLKDNPKVCFTVMTPGEVKYEGWVVEVESVMALGTARLITDLKEVAPRLRQLAAKYYPNEQEIAKSMADAPRAQLIEITIEHLTGKRIKEK